MGLKSGKSGVKAVLREKFPASFREYTTLCDARTAARASRGETVAHVDGNVIFHAVPQSARSIDDFVAVIYSSLLHALSTASVVVVAFDEPDVLTEAKVGEQMKRDASRASAAVVSSEDLQDVVLDDDYDIQYIRSVNDVHALKANRRTRQRFFDEVAMLVFHRLVGQIERWTRSGHDGGHVLFDGIDERGGGRPIGALRKPDMVTTATEIAELYKRTTRIGEGDLKLRDLGRTVREKARGEDTMLSNTKLILTTTIDTDSFAIELVAESCRADEEVTQANTLLCIRERAQKRGTADEVKAYYLCCDVSMLHSSLQRHMFGLSREPSAFEQRAALCLLVGGWAAVGCDFVEVSGMRADVVFDCIPELVRTRADSVELMKHAWQGEHDKVPLTETPIKELVMACASKISGMPRVRKDRVSAMMHPEELLLKRLSWVAAYWCGVEYKDVSEFGFVLPFAAS